MAGVSAALTLNLCRPDIMCTPQWGVLVDPELTHLLMLLADDVTAGRMETMTRIGGEGWECDSLRGEGHETKGCWPNLEGLHGSLPPRETSQSCVGSRA